jgi:AraC-like DNA-binding protein
MINRKKIFLFFAPPVFLWLSLLAVILSSPVIRIADQYQTFPFGVYSDKEFNGHSEAAARRSDHAVVFEYELKEGFSFPYAGMYFNSPSKWLRLKKGQELCIELSSSKSKIIPIVLNEYLQGISDTIHDNLYRVCQYDLKLEPGKNKYIIPVSSFETPSWWYKSNHLNKSSLPDFNPHNIRNICIQNCALIGTNTKDATRILSFSVKTDYSLWIRIALGFSVLWMIFMFIYILIKRKKTSVFIPYVSTGEEISLPDEWEKVRAFISTHYMKEIDMELIEKDLGIARHKIAALIKENTSIIFKQYLNQIRVAEAKRLLTETDMQVGEIADRVGFGHISNFNRVFKEYTGQSPSDLRKNLSLK